MNKSLFGTAVYFKIPILNFLKLYKFNIRQNYGISSAQQSDRLTECRVCRVQTLTEAAFGLLLSRYRSCWTLLPNAGTLLLRTADTAAGLECRHCTVTADYSQSTEVLVDHTVRVP